MSTKPIENAEVGIKSIVPNKLNPRKTFDKEQQAELAASIKQLGVLQPVVLRPKGKKYELVAGERRFKAAQDAGLATLPARIVEMTDKEVLEAAIVENEQRADVNDFERADGYAELIEKHGVTIEDVAARVGKSVSTIRALLRLRNVPVEAKKAHAQGILSTAVCQLIAARPNALMRHRVCQQALTKQTRWGHPSKDGSYPTYRELKDWIERECMVELKQAPFDTKDAKLDARAGSCLTCPKRTGNNREEYPDGRADICTDPSCYAEKAKRHKDQVLKKAKDAGHKIMSESKAQELFYYDGELTHSQYYDLAKQCPHDQRQGKRPRSYKQLLDGHIQPDEIQACIARDGKMHLVIERKIADPILAKKVGLKTVYDSRGLSPKEAAYQKKQREKEKKQKEEKRKLVDEAMSRLVGTTKPVNVPKQTEDVLRQTALQLFYGLWGTGKQEIFRGRGIKGGDNKQKTASIKSMIEGANCHELIVWLGEMLAVRMSMDYPYKPAELKKLFETEAEKK